MDFSKLANRARQLIDKRGGTAAVKEDPPELKDVAGEDESVVDQPKEADEAVQDPGAPGPSA